MKSARDRRKRKRVDQIDDVPILSIELRFMHKLRIKRGDTGNTKFITKTSAANIFSHKSNVFVAFE